MHNAVTPVLSVICDCDCVLIDIIIINSTSMWCYDWHAKEPAYILAKGMRIRRMRRRWAPCRPRRVSSPTSLPPVDTSTILSRAQRPTPISAVYAERSRLIATSLGPTTIPPARSWLVSPRRTSVHYRHAGERLAYLPRPILYYGVPLCGE